MEEEHHRLKPGYQRNVFVLSDSPQFVAKHRDVSTYNLSPGLSPSPITFTDCVDSTSLVVLTDANVTMAALEYSDCVCRIDLKAKFAFRQQRWKGQSQSFPTRSSMDLLRVYNHHFGLLAFHFRHYDHFSLLVLWPPILGTFHPTR